MSGLWSTRVCKVLWLGGHSGYGLTVALKYSTSVPGNVDRVSWRTVRYPPATTAMTARTVKIFFRSRRRHRSTPSDRSYPTLFRDRDIEVGRSDRTVIWAWPLETTCPWHVPAAAKLTPRGSHGHRHAARNLKAILGSKTPDAHQWAIIGGCTTDAVEIAT